VEVLDNIMRDKVRCAPTAMRPISTKKENWVQEEEDVVAGSNDREFLTRSIFLFRKVGFANESSKNKIFHNERIIRKRRVEEAGERYEGTGDSKLNVLQRVANCVGWRGLPSHSRKAR
jgi:hypothetical protein